MTAVRREDRVRYDCPHCRAGLEHLVDRWRGWRLCPACGKPGLPPPPRLVVPTEPTPADGAGLRAEAWIASGDVPDEGWPRWSRASAPVAPRPSAATSAARTLANVGLGIALFVLLIAYLDQRGVLAAVCFVAAIVIFLARRKLDSRG